MLKRRYNLYKVFPGWHLIVEWYSASSSKHTVDTDINVYRRSFYTIKGFESRFEEARNTTVGERPANAEDATPGSIF